MSRDDSHDMTMEDFVVLEFDLPDRPDGGFDAAAYSREIEEFISLPTSPTLH